MIMVKDTQTKLQIKLCNYLCVKNKDNYIILSYNTVKTFLIVLRALQRLYLRAKTNKIACNNILIVDHRASCCDTNDLVVEILSRPLPLTK